MNSIMMVDGYDLPFDGVKRKHKAKKTKTRRRHKKGASHSASWLCAGAKRAGACRRAVKARKNCKK